MAVLSAATPQRFLAVWLGVLLAALAAAAALNWAVDPYAVFGTALGPADKPAAIAHPFLAKTYLLERAHPSTLLVGASRVDIGLNPTNPAWPHDHGPVFNFGMPGAGLPTLAHLLRHALAVSDPKLVVIGLSLDDCLVTLGRPPAPDPEMARLAITPDGAPNPGRWRARLDDAVTALLSISATTDSVATLLGARGQSRMTPLGFNDGQDFATATQAEGPAALFLAKDRDKIAGLLPWSRHRAFDLTGLADMLAVATAHGAEVTIFVYPNSGEDLEIIRRLGAADTFDRWRTGVVQAVADATSRGAKVTLWDFSGFTPYQTEPLPPPGNRTPLHWFWETNHFTAALGNQVIARLRGAGDPAFGAKLDATSLPSAQARFDAAWQAYTGSHPDVIARVDGLYQPAYARLCAADPCGTVK